MKAVRKVMTGCRTSLNSAHKKKNELSSLVESMFGRSRLSLDSDVVIRVPEDLDSTGVLAGFNFTNNYKTIKVTPSASATQLSFVTQREAYSRNASILKRSQR